ncbi:MAG: MFS transporter [Chloroflexi bacterium]|jgi:UMF1 family MFS transporter|nr:MFS transporter [Chloroflexota bacterium]
MPSRRAQRAERRARRATHRERVAWYLYDFGNSAYASVVLLAVFAAYFKEQVVGTTQGTYLWGLAIGIAMLVVTVISPVLGTIADYSGAKKRLLLFFTGVSIICTALLFFVQKGDIWQAMLLFILAEIGYRSAQVYYDGLLPEIAGLDEVAEVSGKGWAIGSVGGVVILLIILPLILLFPGPLMVRLSLPITALYFGLSTLPLIFNLKERAASRPLPPGETYISLAYRRLGSTFRGIRSFREFGKYLLAFLIYNDGVIMALDFAAIIGAVLFGMGQQELILFVILVNVFNAVGAWAFGLLAARTTSKRALLASLVMMIFVILWMFLAQTIVEFFVIGALAGVAMAGIQSLSRTMLSEFAPEGRSAEFFGFFAVAGRTSSFIGPYVYGVIATFSANHMVRMGASVLDAEKQGQRWGILSIGAFLLVGMLVLLTVNERRAIQVAQSFGDASAPVRG